MAPFDHKAAAVKILASLADPGAVSLTLADLTGAMDGEIAGRLAAETKAAELAAANEKLQKDNMALYLRIGAPPAADPDHKDPETKRTFESLFNEKGGLK